MEEETENQRHQFIIGGVNNVTPNFINKTGLTKRQKSKMGLMSNRSAECSAMRNTKFKREVYQ
jgi:hypothetical protein